MKIRVGPSDSKVSGCNVYVKQCTSAVRVDVCDDDGNMKRSCVYSVESRGSVQCCGVSECV